MCAGRGGGLRSSADVSVQNTFVPHCGRAVSALSLTKLPEDRDRVYNNAILNTHTRARAHTHTHTHTNTHTHTHARTHARTHTHTRMHARTHARTHTHTRERERKRRKILAVLRVFCVVREQEIAQWVELPAERPGAILTRVRVLGVARDFLLPQSASSANSLTVLVQSPCDAITPINICTHVKKPQTLQPYLCLNMQKY